MAEQETLDAKIGGQEVSMKVNNLNTVATVATLIAVVVSAVLLFNHGTETKDASRELVSALREMAQAAREQNCLMGMSPDERPKNADFCKRITR